MNVNSVTARNIREMKTTTTGKGSVPKLSLTDLRIAEQACRLVGQYSTAKTLRQMIERLTAN